MLAVVNENLADVRQQLDAASTAINRTELVVATIPNLGTRIQWDLGRCVKPNLDAIDDAIKADVERLSADL